MRNLIERYKAWRKRRYWEKRHLGFMRAIISEDARWLSANPQGRMLLERYEKLVSDKWYTYPFQSIERLRQELGWCPHDPKNKAAAALSRSALGRDAENTAAITADSAENSDA